MFWKVGNNHMTKTRQTCQLSFLQAQDILFVSHCCPVLFAFQCVASGKSAPPPWSTSVLCLLTACGVCDRISVILWFIVKSTYLFFLHGSWLTALHPWNFQVKKAIGVSFCFFPFIFISWRLITLQYWSGFCHTLTWISHEFTCVPRPDPPSHLPPHPISLGLPSAPALSTCLMHPTWAGDLFHFDSVLVSMLFSQNIPPSPSPTESKSLFCMYICVSFSVLHIGLALPSF